MKVISSIEEWKKHFFKQNPQGNVGLVPTMGALHRGHSELIRRSIEDNQKTVVSIFVNPTQFNDAADLENYPRTLQKDLDLLNELGVDWALTPSFSDMYPDNYQYRVTENQWSQDLCGSNREGHFDGVLTIVLKLLNLVQPSRVYFGEKDFQQLQLVQGLVNAFFIPVSVVPVPTVRESDGLAVSSRNKLLTQRDRQLAPQIHATIKQSNLSSQQCEEKLRQCGFKVDYVKDLGGRRYAAAFLGEVRLIDNVELQGGQK